MKPQKVPIRTPKESYTSNAEDVEIVGRRIVEVDQDNRNINTGLRKQQNRAKQEKNRTSVKVDEIASLQGSTSHGKIKDGVSSAVMLMNECLTQQNNSEEELLPIVNVEETEANQLEIFKTGLKSAISPHSIQINNNKEIARQETYEQTPIETQQADSPFVRGRQNTFGATVYKELDNLQSVRDASEEESRLTNRTSQRASPISKRLEPAMQANRLKSSIVHVQQARNRWKQKSSKTKALLNKGEENTKVWEMDFATGQITVKYHKTVGSVRSSQIGQKEANKTIDIETTSFEDRILVPRQTMINKAVDSNINTLTADLASFRLNNNEWTQKLPSTLVKDSVLASLELLDSPSALAKQLAKVNQSRVGIQHEDNADDKLKQQGVQFMQAKNFITGSQVASDKKQGNILCAPDKRYLGHKRVQSAQTNAGGFKSRGKASGVVTSCSSVNASTNFANFRDQLQNQQKGSGIVVQSENGTFKQLVRGQNLNTEWDYQPNSTISCNQSNKKRSKARGSNWKKHASRSPNNQITQSVRHLNSNSRNVAQSYNQHKLAERLLAEEEQIARETDLMNVMMLKGHDPETLLRRNDKTNRSQNNKEVLETLFKSQKYDSKQNILLAKNPLIIRKDTFANQKDFNAQTAKSIIEILDKQSLASQINGKRFTCLKALDKVQDRQLTDLTMLRENSKLRKRKGQEMAIAESADQLDLEEQLKSLSLYDGRSGLIFENKNMGDVQIMKDQSKTNHALFNFLGKLQLQQAYQIQQNQPAVTSSVSFKQPKLQSQEKRPKLNLNQAAVNQRLHDQNKKRRLWSSSGIAPNSRDLAGSNRVQANDAKTTVREKIVGGLTKQESSDVVYQSMKQIPSQPVNKDAGQVNKEQSKTLLGPNDNIQKRIDDGNHLLVSMEIEWKDRTDVKQSEQNFELLTQTNAKVSSIEIAHKAQNNVNATVGHSESSKAEKLFDLKVGTNKIGDQLKNDDYSYREDIEAVGLNKSKSFAGPNLLDGGAQFKQRRKRCQSAYPLNKKQIKSDGNYPPLNSSLTAQIALEVQGKNLSMKQINNGADCKSQKKIVPPTFKEKHTIRLFEGDNSEVPLPSKKFYQSNLEATTEARGDPKSPFSQAEDQTPLGYLPRLMPPASGDYHQQIVPQDFTGAIKNHIKDESAQKYISPTKQGSSFKDKNFSTVQLSRRKPKENALSETVNTDLIIFNPISEKGSILDYKSKDSITNGIQTVTLSTVMQQPKNSRPAGIQLNIPLQNQEAARSSKEYQSTLTVNTRSLVITANNKNGDKTNLAGQSDVIISAKNGEIISRNEPTMHLTQHVSVPSTAKITDNVSHVDTSTQRHKIIQPESIMGQLYQKTKRGIHQKGKTRPQNLVQQKTGEPSSTKSGKAFGVTYTDFNSNLNFDMNSADFKLVRPVRPQSYKNWKQQSKVKQKSINISHQNKKRKSETRPWSNIHNSQQDDAECLLDQQQQKGIEKNLPSMTQILITTIENVQERPTQLATKPLKQQKQIFEKRRSTVKSYIFSPSEKQLVLAELQELPADFMAGASNHQASRSLHQTLGGPNQASGGLIVMKVEKDLEPQKVGPVKILHKKGLISRKKGLSLVKYPQSFIEGPRQIVANRSRQKRPGSKNQLSGKHFTVTSAVGVGAITSENVRASNESPPLQVVNSQKMIMMQRSKASVVESHQKHIKGSPRKLGQKITLGVSPNKDPVFMNLKGHFNDDFLKSDSEDVIVTGNPNTGFSRPSELLQNINDQSNHITDEGALSKDLNTKIDTQQSIKYCRRPYCKGCPLKHRALSALKNVKEAQQYGLTRNQATPIGTLFSGEQVLIQDPLSSTRPPALSDDGNTSMVNSSTGRRGVMSRAGSFSKPDRSKLSPAQKNLYEGQNTAAVNVIDQALSNSKQNSLTSDSREKEKFIYTQRDDQYHISIDSNPMNALETSSENQNYGDILPKVTRLFQPASNKLKIQKINSESTLDNQPQ